MYTVGDNSQWSWRLGVCVESWSCYICTCTYVAMSAMPAHVASGAYERRSREGACNSGFIQILITYVVPF